ncbi:MAG: ribbon-helix-helix domain-containing protein [Nanopusillaceae archaeon]
MTEKVTVCVDLDRRLAETVDRLWPRLRMRSRSELIRALLAEFVQKHKIEEEKDDFEVLRGRW